MSDSVSHRRQPTRLRCPWDSPGKNTGVGCHFLLQCTKVKSESEVTQSCPNLSDPMDCSLPAYQIRILRPWDFPGKSTGVGCHCLLRLGDSNYRLKAHLLDTTNKQSLVSKLGRDVIVLRTEKCLRVLSSSLVCKLIEREFREEVKDFSCFLGSTGTTVWLFMFYFSFH